MKWLKTLFSQNLWINGVVLTGICLSVALAAYGFWRGLPPRSVIGGGVFIIFSLVIIFIGLLGKDFRLGNARGPPISRNKGRALVVSMGLVALCSGIMQILPEEAVRDYLNGFRDFTLPVRLSDRTLDGGAAAIIGLVTFLIGLFGGNFREGDIPGDGPPIPTILGKAMFMVVGLYFLAVGIATIRSEQAVQLEPDYGVQLDPGDY